MLPLLGVSETRFQHQPGQGDPHTLLLFRGPGALEQSFNPPLKSLESAYTAAARQKPRACSYSTPPG